MILWIDACAREDSRTRVLSRQVLQKLDGEVTHLELYAENLPTMTGQNVEDRAVLARKGLFEDEIFTYARQFAAADTLVISAPYWDLSFPAVLKKYIESVCVSGLTFRYDEHGVPVGLCRAEKMIYVSTSGGPYLCPEFGYGYVKALCEGMFGIRKCELVYAENLDIIGADVPDILSKARKKYGLG